MRCACSPAGRAGSCRASRPSRRRSRGASTCSPRSNARCWHGCRCSAGRSTSRAPRRSAAVTACRRSPCSTPSNGWSTAHWWSPVGPVASPCSRPSVSTDSDSSWRLMSTTPSGGATRSSSSASHTRWRRRPRPIDKRTRSPLFSRTTTTSAPPCSGCRAVGRAAGSPRWCWRSDRSGTWQGCGSTPRSGAPVLSH